MIISFLKKILGFKTTEIPEKDSSYIVITLNDRIQPIDRGDYYEDDLDVLLKKFDIGEVAGGGTLMAENGEIEFVDIEIKLSDDEISKVDLERVIQFLEDKGAPKKSQIKIEFSDEVIPIGNLEGLALYLDGINLENDVYEKCDSTFVVTEVKKLVGDTTCLVRYWESNEKTGLYFYGKSFEEMHKAILPFINDYPLCKNAEVKQIA